MTTRSCAIVLIVALLSFTAPGGAELTKDQITAEFRSAQQAFREAGSIADPDRARSTYTTAALHYERIITEGNIHAAPVYYNLANAYLLKDDIGRAILNYRRAEKLDPSNPDIHKNITFARTKRIDAVQVKTQKKVLRTLFFWHYDFSIKTRLVIACVSFAIIFTALTLLVWFGRNTSLVVICVISTILTLSFAASVTLETISDARQSYGVIVSRSVIARQGDGNNYPPSFKDPLHAGTEFDLIEKRPGWLQIQLADGSTGWIVTNAAELL